MIIVILIAVVKQYNRKYEIGDHHNIGSTQRVILTLKRDQQAIPHLVLFLR